MLSIFSSEGVACTIVQCKQRSVAAVNGASGNRPAETEVYFWAESVWEAAQKSRAIRKSFFMVDEFCLLLVIEGRPAEASDDPQRVLSDSTRYLRPGSKSWRLPVSDSLAGCSLRGCKRPLASDSGQTGHYRQMFFRGICAP